MTKTCPPHKPATVTEEEYGGLFQETPESHKVWYMCDRCGALCGEHGEPLEAHHG